MESAVHPSFGKAANLCSLTHYHRMTQSPLLFFTVSQFKFSDSWGERSDWPSLDQSTLSGGQGRLQSRDTGGLCELGCRCVCYRYLALL